MYIETEDYLLRVLILETFYIVEGLRRTVQNHKTTRVMGSASVIMAQYEKQSAFYQRMTIYPLPIGRQ